MNIYIDGIIYSLQKSGGVTRYTDELIDGFIKSGYIVTLFLHPYPKNHPSENKNLKIIFIEPKIKTSNKSLRYLNYIFSISYVNKYLKKRNITNAVLHSTYLTSYNHLKIPQFITIHDLTREKYPDSFNYIKNKIVSYITQKALNRSQEVLVYSNQTKDDLSKYYKVKSSKKINVIPLGVNPLFKLYSAEDKDNFKKSKNIIKPYLLYTGTRAPYKNFKYLLDSFSQWERRNDFNIIVTGGEKFNDKEREYIQHLGLTEHVINFEFSKEEELIMFYNCAQGFIFPSFSEGFGLPILEAMSCGTPILASDIKVFREIGRDIPYYFDPKDIQSILCVLKEYLENKDQERIKSGIELAHEYRWEITVNKTLEVYKRNTH